MPISTRGHSQRLAVDLIVLEILALFAAQRNVQMPERTDVTAGICFYCVTSLLLAVMVSPLLPQRPAEKAIPTIRLMRKISTPPDDSIRLHLNFATDNSWAVKADVMDDDEEDKSGHTAAQGLPFAILPPPPSSERSPRPITRFQLSQASWMLRC
jgi:hypothetical protein